MVRIEYIDKDLEEVLIQRIRKDYGLSDDIPVKITSLDIYVRKVCEQPSS